MLSSGLKRDLIVLLFANMLLKLSANKHYEGLTYRDRSNKSHKTNARIERRIKKLSDLCESTLDLFAGNFSLTDGEWYRRALHTKVLPTLDYMEQHAKPNLETIGLYVLFVTFCERDKPLDSRLEVFADETLYWSEMDLIKTAGIGDDFENAMMLLAYEVRNTLKG